MLLLYVRANAYGRCMCKVTEGRLVKTVTLEAFAVDCLDLIDLVEENGFTFIITKGGRPFVMMIPAPSEAGNPSSQPCSS